MDPIKPSRSNNGLDAWIAERFLKRECVFIVPNSKDSNKCGCGRHLGHHYYAESEISDTEKLRWGVTKCTNTFASDAYGTLSFQGVHSSNKSQYIRLEFGTDPIDIWRLLVDVWRFEPPKLVITVNGSCSNWELQPTLMRALRKGLLNAAKTTNAWIITSGIRAGATKHIINALSENFSAKKAKFTVIGILPWGALKRNDDLLNLGGTLPYYPQNVSAKSRYVTLCEGHSCFLLVDNGTTGRFGSEQFLRRRLEDFLKQKTLGKSTRPTPMVGLMLGGGRPTIQAVLTHVSGKPPVPIVVCAGSGKSSDVLTLAYKLIQEDKEIEENYKRQLVRMIEDCFQLPEVEAKKIYKAVSLIAKRRNLINIFSCVSIDDEDEELDWAILNALLKDEKFSPVDQLSLLLTWNREDLAREMFEKGHDWPEGSLDTAMMFALAYDRVGFVKLLLENGIAMDKFLTINRLEDLYNTKHGPANILKFILQDVVMDVRSMKRFTLPNVGLIIEKLMGGGFRSTYCRKEFRRRYKHYQLHVRRQTIKDNGKQNSLLETAVRRTAVAGKFGVHFNYPFHDLFLWAVLTKRHEMAMCMWEHGEEPLAKALIGYKLNKMLYEEAKEDYFKVEVCSELRQNAKSFKNLASQLLEQCYQTDDDLTFQLLTYELKYWSKKSCISLAALASHKKLLAHPCCQMLMADLWLGGMRIRKNAGVKVVLSILCPPLILLLPFKTQEQLLYQPQTAEEFHENRPEDANNHDEESDSGSSAESSDEGTISDVESGDAMECHGKISEVIATRDRKKSVSKNGPLSNSSGRILDKLTPSNSKLNIWTTSETVKVNGVTNEGRRGSIQERRISIGRSASLTNLNEQASPPPADVDSDGGGNISECNSPACKPRRLTFRSTEKTWQFVLSLSGSFADSKKEQQFLVKQKQELSVKKKLQEFYQAPIVCFWSFVIGYVFFLGCYTYTVLVRTTDVIYWPEAYVILFIITFAVDQIRRVLLQEPKSFPSKLKVYSQKMWDVLSLVACLMFFAAMVLRVSDDADLVMDGRVLYCCNIPFWYMRCLHLLTVSSALGPYIFMYGKMVIKMCVLSTILFVLLMSFGIVRQSILVNNQTWSWELLQSVVYKPYFMLYGELYADHIDDCGDNGIDCVPGFWLTPIFMTVYLLLSIIVFVNMMISTFNYVFIEVQSKTHLVWQIQRYDQVIEYEQQPFLPPPFIIFEDIYLLCKYIYRRICKRDKVYHFEHSLKLYLTTNELDKLHDFEMICLKELLMKKENDDSGSVDEQLKELKEKMEALSQKIEDRFDQLAKEKLPFVILNDKSIRLSNEETPQTPTSPSAPSSMASDESEHQLDHLDDKERQVSRKEGFSISPRVTRKNRDRTFMHGKVKEELPSSIAEENPVDTELSELSDDGVQL